MEALAWLGDSGGPALIDVSGTYYVAGVNSNGDCCRWGDEDEYTRLGSVKALEWISQNTSNSAVNGGVLIEDYSDCSEWDIALNLMFSQAAFSLLCYLAF